MLCIDIVLLFYKGALMDDINHTGQVGTQLYMSPEQVIIFAEFSLGLPSQHLTLLGPVA